MSNNMQISDISFGTNGVMFVAPTGVRILSRCIASSEYSCTFKYFAALNVSDSDDLKRIIANMTESETEYNSSEKSIVMQTVTERDAYNSILTPDNIMALGEIDMTNHVITSKADFTEVYIHLPNRFGTHNNDESKKVKLNEYGEICFDVSEYPGQPSSFKEFFYDGIDFDFNAIAIYMNINDGKNSYNSLYGIYIPNTNADTIHKYAYSHNNSIVHSGNSFGFRINLRLVEDSDNNGAASPIQTVIDERTNSFSMHMFTDALAKMQMTLDSNKDLSESLSDIYDNIENLKALCDTGTTIAALADKVAKLSEYIDNYMLAIEDKDSLLNMISNLNRQIQSIINGEAGVAIDISVPVQSGDGIYINTYGNDLVINNSNQRYHIKDSSVFNVRGNTRSFTPTTFSNIFPVYSKNPDSGNMVLNIDTTNNPQFKFKQGQSFQFVVVDDYNWDNQKCVIKIDNNIIQEFYPNKDIQCKTPIFEVICIDANNGSNEGGTFEQCSFWCRCINPKFSGNVEDNLISVTYEEAVKLRDNGELKIGKIYYLTDYEFIPESDSHFINRNEDIRISIYMRPSDKTHFDPYVYMIISTKRNGRYCCWGDYYLTKDDAEISNGSRLRKGYITKLQYKTIEANFDFIHCAIKKSNDIETKFRNDPAEFLQSLNGGDYDDWLTNDSIISNSPCSIDDINAISSSYIDDDNFPTIDIDTCTNINICDNRKLFKLPIIHIASCKDIRICDCDHILLYGVNYSVFESSSDIMAKICDKLRVSSSDNLRLWNVYHSSITHTFNSWIYSSENISIQNTNSVLLDTHNGSSINNITGNSIVILNYHNGTVSKAMKASIDNANDGCVILDNNKILTYDYDDWRFICNRYDALATQRSSGSTAKEYYMIKNMYYMNDSMEVEIQKESIQITEDNINDLI